MDPEDVTAEVWVETRQALPRPRVTVAQGQIPRGWPAVSYDLIVLSELRLPADGQTCVVDQVDKDFRLQVYYRARSSSQPGNRPDGHRGG